MLPKRWKPIAILASVYESLSCMTYLATQAYSMASHTFVNCACILQVCNFDTTMAWTIPTVILIIVPLHLAPGSEGKDI